MSHNHAPARFGRAFALGIGLNVVYVVVEATVGIWGNSLALLSDAGHNLSDVIGLLLAWAGHTLAQIPPSCLRTYGWRSSTILAALFNALLLLAAVGGIVTEAIRRLAIGAEIPSAGMIAVAALGVLINTATALLFLRGRHHDLNIRGAFLHMAADAAVSLGVVMAGIAIHFTQLTWIDPVASLVIAATVFFSTWDLLKQSLLLAMQAVPPGIDPQVVRELLTSAAGVTQVRDLHIWAMSTTENALTAHLVKPRVEDDDRLLRELEAQLQERFGIAHITIQIDRADSGKECSLGEPCPASD